MVDLLEYERGCWDEGYELVAGVDETGRGALAGPMVAAAVILPRGFDPTSQPVIRDSKWFQKKPNRREDAYRRILGEATSISVAWVTAAEIDGAAGKGEFDECNRELLRIAVEALRPRADCVLIDYLDVNDLTVPSQSIPHGDALSATIAAASVVAKVTRDRMMVDLAVLIPGYGFERHKGYGGQESDGSRQHEQALQELGPSPIHRLSSKGVLPYVANPSRPNVPTRTDAQ